MIISKRHYNQPTLPHVLSEYGFQDKEAERLKKGKEKEKESRKTVKKKDEPNSFDEIERERALEKEKEREEQCLRLVKDIYRLRDYYYKEYKTLLVARVEKQRAEIKVKDSERQKIKEAQEEKERLATHKVKKRLKRVTLDQTPPPLNVPKTDLYYIIGLEEKLKREGKLKTVVDYNRFRAEMSQPEIFYNSFKVHKFKDETNYGESLNEQQSSYSHGESNDSIFSLESKFESKGRLDAKLLSRISESQESKRSENMAGMQQRNTLSRGKTSSSISTKTEDIEKRFPKLEMPKLHCFTMDLSEKLPDPEEVLAENELKAKELHRKRLARTVTKMYQLAMSNTAISSRILDQHEDFKMFLHGPSLNEVIADNHWTFAANGVEESARGINQYDDEDYHDQERRLQTIPEMSSATGSQDSEIEDKEMSNQEPESTERLTIKDKSSSIPLTMDEIKQALPTLESKALSTFWYNYM